MNTFEYSILTDWGNGFTAGVTVNNRSNSRLDGWTVEFDAPFEITEIWNAEIVSRQGNRYILRNASWNRILPPDGTVSFGFNGSKPTGASNQPSNLVLKGQASTPISSPTPTPAPSPAPISTSSGSDPLVFEAEKLSLSGYKVGDNSAASGNKLIALKAAGNSTGKAFGKFNGPSGTYHVKLTYFDETDGTGELAVAIAGQKQSVKLDQQLSDAFASTKSRTSRTVFSNIQLKTGDRFEIQGKANQGEYARVDKIEFISLVPSSSAPNPSPAPSPTPSPVPAPVPSPAPAPLPNLTINDVAVTEGNSGTTNAVFTVKLSQASNRSVSVKYATADGTAIAGSDYTATSGTLTFNAGETSKTIAVAIKGDTTVEGNETFAINLTSPANAKFGDGRGNVTIRNDDSSSSNPPPTSRLNYAEALQKSFLFYEAQRAGRLPSTNRIQWRGDSALKDGADVGVDLSGGYYDAGDHVKFGFPMASSMTMLSWGINEYRSAYTKSGQLDEALDAVKWGTDYILKAHVTDSNGKTVAFYGQVGDGYVDHAYWGSPEKMTMNRPTFKIDRQNPGSDLAGETAAALAAASIAFRQTNPAYADTLLKNARQLYEFAETYKGKYSDSITNAREFYNSWSGYNDELSWGAAWLHKATGDPTYLAKAEQYYQGLSPNGTQSWDNKSYGAGVLLAQATGKSRYTQDVEQWLDNWTNGSIKKTEGGLAWLDKWGANRYTANTAFLAEIYSDTVATTKGDRYSTFAKDQIDYLLGDNPNKFSYQVGYGSNYAQEPHHRAASGVTDINTPGPNKYILYGALVGGPETPSDNGYQDERNNFVSNEVALDYNAGFTGMLAALYDTHGGTLLSDSKLAGLSAVANSNAL